MIARTLIFLQFVGSAWIKDEFYALLQKSDDVSMRNFSRIAYGFGRDSFDTFFVDVFRRTRRNPHAEAEFGKKRKPQRIIFVHI